MENITQTEIEQLGFKLEVKGEDGMDDTYDKTVEADKVIVLVYHSKTDTAHLTSRGSDRHDFNGYKSLGQSEVKNITDLKNFYDSKIN